MREALKEFIHYAALLTDDHIEAKTTVANALLKQGLGPSFIDVVFYDLPENVDCRKVIEQLYIDLRFARYLDMDYDKELERDDRDLLLKLSSIISEHKLRDEICTETSAISQMKYEELNRKINPQIAIQGYCIVGNER